MPSNSRGVAQKSAGPRRPDPGRFSTKMRYTILFFHLQCSFTDVPPIISVFKGDLFRQGDSARSTACARVGAVAVMPSTRPPEETSVSPSTLCAGDVDVLPFRRHRQGNGKALFVFFRIARWRRSSRSRRICPSQTGRGYPSDGHPFTVPHHREQVTFHQRAAPPGFPGRRSGSYIR